jgi:hypothetical protein
MLINKYVYFNTLLPMKGLIIYGNQLNTKKSFIKFDLCMLLWIIALKHWIPSITEGL